MSIFSFDVLMPRTTVFFKLPMKIPQFVEVPVKLSLKHRVGSSSSCKEFDSNIDHRYLYTLSFIRKSYVTKMVLEVKNFNF